MADTTEQTANQAQHETIVERSSDNELVVTRSFDAPLPTIFAAWTRPDLLKQWWAPKSFGVYFIACEADVRSGGQYRFVFGHPATQEPMEFFGRYIEVVPDQKLVWTNEESGEGGAVTTVSFEEHGATTRVTMHDLYPTPEALQHTIDSGGTCGFSETFTQLDALLADTK